MLSGAKPDEIMCLTFTRAAAAVMSMRIRDELDVWASADDKELETRLQRLSGTTPSDDEKNRARGLFTEFLDAHGGLRIQTIHSFAEGLIRRFPIESGIPPYFEVMDDQTAADMLRESQASVLKKVADEVDTPLSRAVRMVTPEVSEDDFATLMGMLTYRRGQLFSILSQHGGLERTVDDVYAYLAAPRGIDSKSMTAQFNTDAGINGHAPDIDALDTAADILAGGSPTDRERAKIIKAWTMNPESRVEIMWDYARVFLTADGERRKRMTTKASAAAEDILLTEADRLMEGIDAIRTMNLARGTESILRLSSAILETYTDKKRALNLLDYDDLVHRANVMLKEDNAGGWVLQKLPGDLKHILVDEAQDTNPDQWQLISSLAREFYTNPARIKAKGHTFFAVGDEKQSIFSFQRADPQEFDRQRKYIAGLVRQSGGEWREVEMTTTFRSAPAITETVDAVFARADAAEGLFAGDDPAAKKVNHRPHRQGQEGIVEVHPVLLGKDMPDPEPWSLPLTREDAPHPAAEWPQRSRTRSRAGSIPASVSNPATAPFRPPTS